MIGGEVNEPQIQTLCHKSQSNSLIFQNMQKKVVPDSVPLVPCFIYKNRVAIVMLKNPVHVAILYNEQLVEHHTKLFNYLWQTAK